MKRILLALTAALALTSCVQDEILDNGVSPAGDGAVTFGTYLGRSAQTKATEVTTETLKTEGFGVNAWYTGQTSFYDGEISEFDVFMNNTRVSHDGTGWIYSPLKYWPNNPGDMVSFVAYAPHMVDADGNTNTHITIDGNNLTYTVANEVKEQVDLLWSDSDYNNTINLTKQSVDDRVLFYFRHALSKINLRVGALIDMVNDDTTDGTLGEEVLAPETVINVKKVVLMGDEEYSDAEGWLTADGPFYTGGTLDIVEGEWQEESLTTGQRFAFTAAEHFVNNEEFVLDQSNSNQLNNLLNDESYLMIIPQDLTTGGFKIYIEYDVITADDALSDGSSVIENKITSANAITSLNFTQGMQYNINMILGMTTVKVDVEVTDWVPSETDEDSDNPANFGEGGATLTQSEKNALLYASRFSDDNVATIDLQNGTVTFADAYPADASMVDVTTYFSIDDFSDVDQVFSDGNGNFYRLPTAGELEMLVPEESFTLVFSYDSENENLTEIEETVELGDGETVSGASEFLTVDEISVQTESFTTYVTYALRFKGSGQYAAYRYEFCEFAADGENTLYGLKIQMKALDADDTQTLITDVAQESYWVEDYVQVELPATNIVMDNALYGEGYGTQGYYLSKTYDDSGIKYLSFEQGGAWLNNDYRYMKYPVRMIFCNEDGSLQ